MIFKFKSLTLGNSKYLIKEFLLKCIIQVKKLITTNDLLPTTSIISFPVRKIPLLIGKYLFLIGLGSFPVGKITFPTSLGIFPIGLETFLTR